MKLKKSPAKNAFTISEMTEESVKTCRICGEIKPLSEYNYRNDSGKYRNECRKCCNRHSREWRLTHKERTSELSKKYRESHKEELAEYWKNYRKTHLEQYREYNKKSRENWTDEQRAKAKARDKRYHDSKIDDPEYLEKRRQWSRESSKRRRKKITAYEEERKRRDPVFKLKKQIRNAIRTAFERRGFNKSEKTESIVGCDIEYFQRYLRMTYMIRYGEEWDGITPVHIDHIKPLSNAHTIDEVYELNRYSNLQLLRKEDNLAKSDSNEPDSYGQFIS